jgi:hypothetical protein
MQTAWIALIWAYCAAPQMPFDTWRDVPGFRRFIWSEANSTIACYTNRNELLMFDLDGKLLWSYDVPRHLVPLMLTTSGRPVFVSPFDFVIDQPSDLPRPVGDEARCFSQWGVKFTTAQGGFLIEPDLDNPLTGSLIAECSPRYSAVGVSPSQKQVAVLKAVVNGTILNRYNWDGSQWNVSKSSGLPEILGTGKPILASGMNDLVFANEDEFLYFGVLYTSTSPISVPFLGKESSTNVTQSGWQVYLLRGRVADGSSQVLAAISAESATEPVAHSIGHITFGGESREFAFVAIGDRIWKYKHTSVPFSTGQFRRGASTLKSDDLPNRGLTPKK